MSLDNETWVTSTGMFILAEMSPEEQLEEIQQFLVDMMDCTEHTPAEDLYNKLSEFIETIKLGESDAG